MLTVPLQAHRKPVNGVEHLVLWANGHENIVPAPIWPYVISLKKLRFNEIEYKEEDIKVKLLDSQKERQAYKYSFPIVQRIIELNNEINNLASTWGQVRENHIDFVERCAVDCPEFFQSFPEDLDSVLTLDIETASDGEKYYDNIIAIGINDGKETWVHTGKEGEILEAFVDDWKRTNPDVVVGYNHKEFDLPRIRDRLKEHSIEDSFIPRNSHAIRATDTGRIHTLPGRSVFDVYEDVADDQTLFGLKNRKLKTVCKHMGIEALEEDTANTMSLSQEELIRYCASDVDATRKLYDLYAYRRVAIANQIVFPFDGLQNPKGARDGQQGSRMGRAKSGASTLIGRVITARGMGKKGWIENGMNRDRFSMFGRIQGAEPTLYYSGYFEDVYHVDYSGMYPSIQMAVNISPETVFLEGYEDYDPSDPFLREKGTDYAIFCVPDANIKRNMVIRVDQSTEGCHPAFLRSCKMERDKYKQQYKKHLNTPQEDLYWSLQYGMKVSMNSVGFGVNAPAFVRYGNFLVALLITGFARYMLKFSRNFLESNGFKIIEDDTDGIWAVSQAT